MIVPFGASSLQRRRACPGVFDPELAAAQFCVARVGKPSPALLACGPILSVVACVHVQPVSVAPCADAQVPFLRPSSVLSLERVAPSQLPCAGPSLAPGALSQPFRRRVVSTHMLHLLRLARQHLTQRRFVCHGVARGFEQNHSVDEQDHAGLVETVEHEGFAEAAEPVDDDIDPAAALAVAKQRAAEVASAYLPVSVAGALGLGAVSRESQ